MDTMSSDHAPGAPLVDRLWTPAAQSAARLDLVADEEPGSMQHFTTALVLGDLLARLHATFLVSVLARFEESIAQRHSYSLARASGGGEWLAALEDSESRLREYELPPNLHRVVRRPARTPASDEEKGIFLPIAGALADLAARLQHREPEPIGKRSPRSTLFNLLVQVRNKTVHGAYDSRFYADHVGVVDSAVRWLLRETPLWEFDLVHMTTRARGRVLQGFAPTHSVILDGDFNRDDVIFSIGGESWRAAPLVHVAGVDTFIANGSWRETGSSAEFLCHSLAAEKPGQGTLRLPLPALARPPLPSVGQTVDRHYRISKILGEGEDAIVYLACHTDEGVEYVLKAFRQPKEAFDQRRIEFEALQRISHPSVPQVHSIHSWEEPFHLRLDYVPGAPLETRRSDFLGNLEASAALGIALAEALHAVHAAGFVHRDIAPDNILIPLNPNDPIRLVDFDQVARIGAVGFAGTSLYRPPESESGAPWTEASDVYSLGVVLFELLTGRLPYEIWEGENDRRRVEPSAEELNRFGNVLAVLLRAASFDAGARYPTALEFVEAFRDATNSVGSA